MYVKFEASDMLLNSNTNKNTVPKIDDSTIKTNPFFRVANMRRISIYNNSNTQKKT